MEFIDNYKFIPKITYLGPAHIILYNTIHENQKILVARTYKGIQILFQHLLKYKYQDLDEEFKMEYLVGTIVKPPLDYEKEYKKIKYREEFSQFKSFLSSMNRTKFDNTGIVIKGSHKCENYKSERTNYCYCDCEDDDCCDDCRDSCLEQNNIRHQSSDENDSDYHFSCLNCIEGFTYDFDLKELFEAGNNRTLMFETQLDPHLKIKKSYPFYKSSSSYENSDIRVQNINNLYVFGGDFGPHARGVIYYKYEDTTYYDYNLFFFEGEKVDFPFSDLLKRRIDEEEQRKKATKKKLENAELNNEMILVNNINNLLHKIGLS
jgi:hypothetical protein